MTARLKRRFPRAPEGEHRLFVIMGVSGSGKSALSQQLSQRYGIACLDGDYLHSRENIAKMASGAALDDADRAPWLKALSDAAWAMQRTNPCSLVVCSALKKRYRDILRAGNPGLRFLFLDGRYEVIEQRLKARKGHYFRPEMLDSQFAALERPGASETDVIAIDIEQSLEDVVTHCATHLFD
ncbi:gluconokinase, GntK/IdnK-type [Entomohabitans teleogrylli]|uniref:gluconokinase, GntK/IdnK-type n=1 Tax=Entomohabitans teleogrylli TaxID=1384589 RepID=UPI00073D6B4B|nr:gluconokinase, GntK/IdnK-type [Entomohabitans teleogrylli]